MLELPVEDRPHFRSKFLPNGYIHHWDQEWFDHFRLGGYRGIEWFELRGGALLTPEVFAQIVNIQVVGEVHDDTLRLYGYVKCGTVCEKLKMKALG